MLAFFRGHWQLVGLTAIVFALWPTLVVTPLKILIVFLHEMSHAIATVLTGGKVLNLTISPAQGGMVISQGGSRFITLTAGYLGSLVIGVALLVTALRTNADRVIMAGFGVIMLVVSLLYIRSAFALSFAIGTGGAMLITARYFGHTVNDLALRVIGLSSMFYVPYDIVSDTILRSHLRSDARMLAEEIGGATILWGLIWLVISLGVIGLCLRYGLGRNSNVVLRPASPTTSSL